MKNQFIQDAYPLSPMQSGLLFQSLYAPESDAYFLQGIFELEGEISTSTMKSAWQKVSNFHPILRTGFFWQDGEIPMQYVIESAEVPFAIENWEHISLKKQQNKLDQFIKADRKRGFDLKKAPLFRVTLIKYAKNKYYLIWSQHHIITDGWCWPIIFGDVLKSYEDISLGKEPSLKARRPYRDYIAWLQQQKLDTAETFWKNYLASINEPTRLSFSNIIDENKSKDYDMCSVSLSIEETEEIKSFAKQHNLTLNTVIQGAVGIVLRTYTQKNEIVMGVTVSGRDIELPGIEEMVGLFINTLPLKISFDPEVNILFFLKSLQNNTQQLNNHSFTPLAQIQSWSNINQSLFDVLFVFENYPIDKENNPAKRGLSINTFQGIEKTEYPLTIAVGPGKELHLSLNYQTADFNEEFIKRFVNHIRITLQKIIQSPKKGSHDLCLLTSVEKQQLLIEWNDTKAPYPSNKCIHELFEEQVDKTPDSIAVIYEDQELSYQQLNERANQLAHYLRSLGVGPDTLVAIAVERSLEMIIGLLGILKAGGAYVPLDPSYPQERIKFMLEDTQASILITQQSLKDGFKDYAGTVIALDKDWKIIQHQSRTNLITLTYPHHLAYVIYTSGSTGKPKGVCCIHTSLVNLVYALNKANTLSSMNKYSLWANISFDASVYEVFSALKAGSLYIFSEYLKKDFFSLWNYIYQQKINYLFLPPAILPALKEYIIKKDSYFIQLFVGAEVVKEKLLTEIIQNISSNIIINAYGPTEITVCATLFQISKKQKIIDNNRNTPIGQPISNTQIYILDTYLNPIPIGVTGEIYIGGAGLARGYLNRPDLTADRFIPNPFISDEDAQQGINLRLYRTGDLARYLPDGNIEFIGRIDDQVKIRGFRIELGEIESTLADHGDVANAIVTVREDEPDNKRLVAYIVPKQNKFLSLTTESTFTSSSDDKISVLSGDGLITLTETLRNHLAQSLPDYMVPSFFVFIDKVPLSPNGKIDRKSLPAPDLSFRNLEDEYVAPSTPLEQELASIWTEVLKIESIGIHDNFFKIGGHSLLATQVISRIRHNYNIDIPLRSLFDHPSIASLSLVVDSLVTGKVNSSLPAIVPMERGSSIPLSFAQQRLWFLDQLLPDSALYNIPIALRLKGSLNLIALEDALNALMQRHESLRTIFPSSQGEASQVILPTYRLDIKDNIIDLANLPSEEQESSLQDIALKEANSPFNLSIGPLVRIKLISLAGKEYALLMTMHHIVSDGWSGSIFFRELSALYNAYAEGNDPLLPSLTIQYADFALWQRKWLQGEVLEQQLSYWKEQLADIPDLMELPTDRPRPKELSHKGGSYHYVLSKDIRDQLNSLAHKNQASLFMTLLTVFQILLYRYSGQKDIVIGSPIANRHYKEIEGIIGFFVNTLALRTTFKDHETFIDILNQVKETTLQAYQHQDVPFEQLVDYLNISRALNRNPVFQVLFTLEKVREENPLIFNSVDINPLHLADPAAKFDLSFNVYESNDGIGIEISYETDLFEYSTIERMGLNFKELIQAIIKDPIQPIEELSILTTEERQQLLIEWNDTKAPYPSNKCVHELFEEQVDKTPDSIAVVYEDQELSYQQLNERANQLAHYLRSLGVGPDTLVAIAVERSLEMFIGLLGILKAGGAYVPLDPSYPQERIKFMLEDSNPSIIIINSSLQTIFNDYLGTIIILDHDSNYFDQEFKYNPSSLICSKNLAYVIYTSGSTGKPKGVMVTYGNLSEAYFKWEIVYNLKEPKNYLQMAQFSFDVFSGDWIKSFCSGGKIILCPKEFLLIPENLYNLITKQNIEFAEFVPSVLRNLISHLNSEKKLLKKLHILVCGSDYWSSAEYKNVQRACTAGTAIINSYGLTEATIDSSYFYGKLLAKTSSIFIPIGRPISNTQMYILDKHNNPVPIGVDGEIYIGGAGLARGYLNRPDLTADRFIPNPFISDEDAQQGINLRLYRTGDLARYLPDGNIEFIGRIDDQVKIRGFRIELGEIESTLADHGDVANAIVTVREDESDNKRLVAYIVPKQNKFLSLTTESTFTSSSDDKISVLSGDGLITLTETLRNHLAQSLPDYMVPSFFVFIDKVPLSPNGKIDRKSLPAPDLSLRNLEDEYVAPSTPLEQELASIWTEVLKIESIGIHDNFFRIGGDSIISIQIIAKARQKKIYFKVKDIFNHPTIASLSTVVQIQENVSALIPNQGLMTGELLLTPIQHWFFDHNFPDKHHYNQATLLQAQETIVFPILVKTVSYLINHHDALRLRYKKTKKHTWIQECYEKEENIICKTVDLSLSSDTNLPYDIEKECSIIQQSLNIEKGPIIRVCLFDCGINRPQRLLIVIHHLAVDGVSWRILLEDLEKVYINLFKEENPSLPPKTHSYQQWAKSLMEYSLSSELNEQIPYWTKVFSFIKPLPIDFDKRLTINSITKTISVSLLKEETTDLLQRVPKAYRTQINDILLTALVLTVGDWTGNYELSLSLEGHGREDIIKDIDLSRTVGWFTSIFPVYLHIENHRDLGEAIKTVKETLRQIPNKGIGYGILTYLNRNSTLNNTPYPNLSFNYLGQWDNILNQQDRLFAFTQESPGESTSKNNTESFLIDINGSVQNGILQLFWSYSTNHYQHSTIERLANSFIDKLKQLIQYCYNNDNYHYTTSDFDLIKINQKSLDKKIEILLKLKGN